MMIFNIPMSQQALRNVTRNIETYWWTNQRFDKPSEHHNLMRLVFMLCLLMVIAIVYIVSYCCHRKHRYINEYQRDAP